jgi:hypothetical protein
MSKDGKSSGGSFIEIRAFSEVVEVELNLMGN